LCEGPDSRRIQHEPAALEPGFVVVCLHVDVPARPGKDENGEDETQRLRRHRSVIYTCTFGRSASPLDLNGLGPTDTIMRRVRRHVLWDQ